MAKYKAYPEYEDSGIEWLGLVPKSWTIFRLKNMATIKNGQDYKFVQADDGYPVMGSGGQFTFSSKFMYDKPSVLLGRKGTIDKPLYINEPFWTVDTMYYTELKKDVDAKYLYYLALTIQFSRYSTNTALPSMTQEHLSNYKFSVPRSESERKKITEFLDHEIAKIDDLIDKQQQLIDLLKEKRQAVISLAVTKGLNPDVPMKDSGVEWLGEVPEHWEVKKLKHVAYIIDCKNRTPEYFDDGEYLVVRTTNVKKQSLVLDGALYTNERDYKIWTERGVPPVGSIFFTREAPAGEVCMVPAFTKLCMGQRMMNFICHQSDYTNFLFDYLTSDCLKRYIESEAAGSTVSHLRVEQVYNIPIVAPPNLEQKNINEMVGIIKTQYSRLIDDAECSLVLLQERRTALISAAVTGKIDVREWVAPDRQDVEESQEATI